MRNSALLSVKVPADAKVFVNEHATTSTGADREYISRDLQAGAQYNYNVRVEFSRDGKNVSETKTVQLAAGKSGQLTFAEPAAPQTADNNATRTAEAPSAETRTTLIVHVPADAKLYLSGQETKATGPVREFSTTKLAAGAQWADYALRAVVDKDGQQQVREQMVSLKAGESREVTISFDAPASEQVANRNTR
jgi:uncharacterized protein (TIGR03000 family)